VIENGREELFERERHQEPERTQPCTKDFFNERRCALFEREGGRLASAFPLALIPN